MGDIVYTANANGTPVPPAPSGTAGAPPVKTPTIFTVVFVELKTDGCIELLGKEFQTVDSAVLFLASLLAKNVPSVLLEGKLLPVTEEKIVRSLCVGGRTFTVPIAS